MEEMQHSKFFGFASLSLSLSFYFPCCWVKLFSLFSASKGTALIHVEMAKAATVTPTVQRCRHAVNRLASYQGEEMCVCVCTPAVQE